MTESEPVGRVVVLKVATPLASRVAVPRLVVPLWKVTVPVGTPLPAFPVTVAVSESVVPRMTDGEVGAAVNAPSDPHIHVSASALGMSAPPGSPPNSSRSPAAAS